MSSLHLEFLFFLPIFTPSFVSKKLNYNVYDMERKLRDSIEKSVEKIIFLSSLVTFWQHSLQSLFLQTGGNVNHSFLNIAARVPLNKVKYSFWLFRRFRKLIPLEYVNTTEKFFMWHWTSESGILNAKTPHKLNKTFLWNREVLYEDLIR